MKLYILISVQNTIHQIRFIKMMDQIRGSIRQHQFSTLNNILQYLNLWLGLRCSSISKLRWKGKRGFFC